MLDPSHRKADKVHWGIKKLKGIFKSKRRLGEKEFPKQRSLEQAIINIDHAAKIAAKLQSCQKGNLTLLPRPNMDSTAPTFAARQKGKQRAGSEEQDEFMAGPSTIGRRPHFARSAQMPTLTPPTPDDSQSVTPTTSNDLVMDQDTSVGRKETLPSLGRNVYQEDNLLRSSAEHTALN
ncbi:hypothetical protein DL95DRAFT_469628 [Leptodontidium sp. 2 PMI_412]|nr:hypothetical protein DL95DRAFT_469628 [Leptodontidium sp. 2 PMI_412]